MLKQRAGEDGQGDVPWIVETRGRVFAGTTDKDRAMEDWCERASDATAEDWRFLRVNQADFDPVAGDLHNFAELVATCGLARLATVEKAGQRASPRHGPRRRNTGGLDSSSRPPRISSFQAWELGPALRFRRVAGLWVEQGSRSLKRLRHSSPTTRTTRAPASATLIRRTKPHGGR